jgi:hypothetical protein
LGLGALEKDIDLGRADTPELQREREAALEKTEGWAPIVGGGQLGFNFQVQRLI